ncbi:radical SAM/SPASM domain-containing protein [Thermocladium modestius]|uniref:Radical SAM/SPASM domain-containing protein n=1 Tax=Thermocladium modestius TaxID=62609 RepID=A0A830GXN3_9CREN|nr:radical SAM/SPASM domain-containing protein [Thermocladium modestius]
MAASDPVLWLLLTTGACNLRCSYCGGSFESRVVPYKTTYDLSKLRKLMEDDPEPTVIFYGGEPLLNPKFVMEAMNSLPAVRWGVQTNGFFVDLLPDEYWNRMSVALLSIDGRREVTDANRGKGVYDRVMRSLSKLRRFPLKIIARMAVTRLTDIYVDVTHLLNSGFDQVHWQLDVIWSEKWDVWSWAETSYLPGVRRLVELFVNELERGRVLGLIPVLGVLSAHFFEPYRASPCGAGYRSVAVSSDGRVLACPIAVREKWAVLGHIETGFKLMEPELPEPCNSCEYRRYCGGRCLYALRENYWGKDAEKVDEITKETIKSILSIIPKAEALMERGIIDREALRYDPILDSTEVIP